MSTLYNNYLKNIIDFILAFIILLVTLPLFLIVLIILTISNNGKPFFYQKRPGKNGRIFSIIKFRTMNDKRDGQGDLLPDVQRITRVGRFVRRTSLDELPQLLSVLKGDMSLIGPRPLLVEYLPLYNDEQARRHEVKPGITGWAQVNGRNAISWEEKFALDIYYVDNVSFTLDLRIFFLTLLKAIRQEGIDFNSTETMHKFTGTKK